MVRNIDEVERDMDDPEAWGEPVRPRKSSKRQRDAVVSVRFTEAELAVVQDLATERNLYLSTLLRDLALTASATVRSAGTESTRSVGTAVLNGVGQPPRLVPAAYSAPLGSQLSW